MKLNTTDIYFLIVLKKSDTNQDSKIIIDYRKIKSNLRLFIYLEK